MSLVDDSLIWFGNLFHSPGTDTRKNLFFLSTLLYQIVVPSEVNWTQIEAFLLVYIFLSDRLDIVALFLSELWMYGTESCIVILHSDLKRTGSQCNWNKTGVICSLLGARDTRRSTRFYTRFRRVFWETVIL